MNIKCGTHNKKTRKIIYISKAYNYYFSVERKREREKERKREIFIILYFSVARILSILLF